METDTKPELESGSAAPRSDWSPGGVLARIGERLGTADVRMIYGEPIERGGMTVIPVAKIRYGFGGGVGRKKAGSEEGTGGGGGVHVMPVGFIEMARDRVRFRRIRSPSPVLNVLGVGLCVLLLARAVGAALGTRRP